MRNDPSWMRAAGRRARLVLGGISLAVLSTFTAAGGEPSPVEEAGFRFPTIPADHKHASALLANAMNYLGPENRIMDSESGYPFEGWNQEPARGIYLRSFTQLTAIGQGMEILANIAAGVCDNPYLSREEALTRLSHQTKSLLQDQVDPRLSSDGLLGNFLDLATGKRLGPLTSDVEKAKVVATFGAEKGDALWKALAAKGWIVPRHGDDGEAAVQRSTKFGWDHFDGELTPYRDNDSKQKIMDLLDQRVVMVVFVDNANLSSSVARSIGALLRPAVKDNPEAVELRRKLECFLDAQRDGYAKLYDPAAGQFYFGRDATKGRLFGWTDLQGKWVTGHVDYLVNEFRGPATFVALRFGLPIDAVKNLGFKIKPYKTSDGRVLHVLAPWEGSAFQALGFELALTEMSRPSWRKLLEDFVDVEIDYSTRYKLPGFLSESYSGQGDQYTGSIGVPDVTVSPNPRITDAPSLYTLGAAYSVAPTKVEDFLAANWPAISRLLTDHGPWEGFNTTRQEVILFQTSAHTFSLILGLLGTASDHMKTYLDSKAIGAQLEAVFQPGFEVDMFSDRATVFAWDDKPNPVQTRRDESGFHVASPSMANLGIAFVATEPKGVNLSGGTLALRYRGGAKSIPVVVALKPMPSEPPRAGLIPTEIYTTLAASEGDGEVQIVLPATPGLSQIKEVVVTFGPESKGKPLDLTITGLKITPRS
ncbi:hypothetical protein [Paludisphaera borealis]|nr:hypothetical protein [Paludisphaera borealis]